MFDAVRGAATFYITITFVVFAFLLSGLQEELDTHIAFTNFVVHYLIPSCSSSTGSSTHLDTVSGLRTALAWLAYPLTWFAYTLVRGRSTDWYPYPFVDVTRHGYGGVLARGVVFVLAFGIGAVVFAKLSDRRSASGRAANRVELKGHS